MPQRKPYKVTCQEAQILFQISAKFSLPEKLGKKTYDIAERGLAVEEARALFRELRDMTPEYDRQTRMLRFGALANWEEDPDNANQWNLKEPDEEVTLRLNEEAHMGAFWTGLLCLHPGSPFLIDARNQDEVIWPVAEKLRLVKMIRKEMGMNDAKPRRLELDGDEDEKSDNGDAGKAGDEPKEPKAKAGAGAKA